MKITAVTHWGVVGAGTTPTAAAWAQYRQATA